MFCHLDIWDLKMWRSKMQKYKTITSYVLLYGFDTLSLILTHSQTLQVLLTLLHYSRMLSLPKLLMSISLHCIPLVPELNPSVICSRQFKWWLHDKGHDRPSAIPTDQHFKHHTVWQLQLTFDAKRLSKGIPISSNITRFQATTE